tara:strand:+ start:3464 stop:5611 length:2148 start_codon:yes stop_codon:yes gene_type:complete
MAQTAGGLKLKKATSPIKVDGILGVEEWASFDTIQDFNQQFPVDSIKALTKTQVFLTYDDKNIYVGAICSDQSKEDYVIQSLKRDFEAEGSDHFAIHIDPFNDAVNGFYFAVNPKGVQREGTIQNGTNVDLVWDHIWFTEVKDYGEYWTLEMAIPFKSIRYKKGLEHWNVNFSRMNLSKNEISTLARVPVNFDPWVLSNTTEVTWDEPVEKPARNISIIPYGIASCSKDFSSNEDFKSKYNVGGDAKIVLTPSLNLDLTVNSDFSQVEVDRQVTNLSRFELFFPEQRTFFIENSDLFAQFGFRQIRPFFSRRIGLQNGKIIPIIGGARVSGKLTKTLRVGLMSIQTADYRDGDTSFNSQNYTVAAFQQQVFARSNIGMIFVNRQDYSQGSFTSNKYNRVAGIDYNIFSKDNTWRGKVFYHKSFSPDNLKFSDAHASWLMRNTRDWFVMWNHEYVGKNYDAQTGFVPRNRRYDGVGDSLIRKGYWRLEPKVAYKMYPKNSKIFRNEVSVYWNQYMDVNFVTTDADAEFTFVQERMNTSRWGVKYTESFAKLLFDRDITFSGNPEHPAGDYRYRFIKGWYITDLRKKLSGSVSSNYGSYFTGTRFELSTGLSYRIQPFVNLTVDYTRTELRMPQEYKNAYFDLIQGKVEITFTRNIYWTSFLQYNTQIDNFNINSRFQWRFRPMSDFYVVYTDNYDLQLNKTRNRTLVFKLILWLNV